MNSSRLLLVATVVSAAVGGWMSLAGTEVHAQSPSVRPQVPTATPVPQPQPRVPATVPQRQPPTLVLPRLPQVVPGPVTNPERVEPRARQRSPEAAQRQAQPRRSQPTATRRATGGGTPGGTAQPRRTNLGDAPLPRPRPRPIGAEAPVPLPRPQPFAFQPALHEPGVVVVAFDGGTPEATVQAFAADHGLTTIVSQASIDLVGLDIYRLQVGDGRPVEAVVADIATDDRAALGVPNHVFAVQDATTGPAALQYAAARLGLEEAHRMATGREVRVALIDTGVDLEHEALRQASIRISTVFETEEQTPAPHGTELAGAMVAQGMLQGVSPSIALVAIEAFRLPREDARAEATTFGIAQALDRAHALDAQIVNMSFAGGHDDLLAALLDALDAHGVVLVAAAGNGGPEASPAFPGMHEKTIAVTAIDMADALYAGANRGDYVSIAAPGVDVIAATVDGRYRMTTGTSIATAHVAGVAALLLEHRPDLSPADMRGLLSETAIDLGSPGPDPEFGAGLIDPVGAMNSQVERMASPVEVGTDQ